MIIDCDRCAVRDLACGDCMVSVLLGPPQSSGAHLPGGTAELETVPSVAVPVGPPATTGPVVLHEPEWRALEALAGSGLVPPLRLVPTPDPDPAAPGPDAPSPRTRRGRAATA